MSVTNLQSTEVAKLFEGWGANFVFSTDYRVLAPGPGNPTRHEPCYAVFKGQTRVSDNCLLKIIYDALLANKVAVPPFHLNPFARLRELPGNVVTFTVRQGALYSVTIDGTEALPSS